MSLSLIKPFLSYEALKSGQGITKWESPYFKNFPKYEAHFTENDVISNKRD